MKKACNGCPFSALCLSQGFEKAVRTAFYRASQKRGVPGCDFMVKGYSSCTNVPERYQAAFTSVVELLPTMCEHKLPDFYVRTIQNAGGGFKTFRPEMFFYVREG